MDEAMTTSSGRDDRRALLNGGISTAVKSVLVMLCCTAALAQVPADPVPQTVEEFRAAAARVLAETGVPGAGLALVRQDGVEWAGGIGYADRERQLPVTAQTGFRVGSVSKTFVAMALVQLAEDGFLNLDATVYELAPDLAIDNPWEETHPVRVIHLLQHTAGFDDMHFNETYVRGDEPDRSLEDVLRLNPRSRRVRWPPGTRMAYSNPGYGVAGLILEKVSAMPYEDYIQQEIFEPLQMTSSSFRWTTDHGATLAQGYATADGGPVGFTRIYLRPAGNMVSSADDMARFVQMLLGWGELGDAFVIDPEYLGNMEQPRTTLAAEAGLRNGYGTGIFTRLDLPYKMLGHDGGIDGFLSSYAYSPSRDVGFVVLLNSTGPRAGEAIQRLSKMALSYLKRDVTPPDKPVAAVDSSSLDKYAGYYQDANPRNQLVWAVRSLLGGRTVERAGDRLVTKTLFGEPTPLIPVSATAFRFDHELDASRVFTADADGQMVMAGAQTYAVRVARWRVELVRIPVLATLPLLASIFVMAVIWLARLRRAQPRGFWELKIALVLCPLAVIAPFAALTLTPMMDWGIQNTGSVTVFVSTLAIPVLALVVGFFTLNAAREGASRLLATYAALVGLAMGGLSLYLSNHDLLGVRLWHY
jgi:CubicO group peptidase (beta-lactamase class C family)